MMRKTLKAKSLESALARSYLQRLNNRIVRSLKIYFQTPSTQQWGTLSFTVGYHGYALHSSALTRQCSRLGVTGGLRRFPHGLQETDRGRTASYLTAPRTDPGVRFSRTGLFVNTRFAARLEWSLGPWHDARLFEGEQAHQFSVSDPRITVPLTALIEPPLMYRRTW